MWAGFSQVESTLASLEAAIAGTGRDCSHIVVVSGADYPLAGNDEILDFFADHAGRQFIRRFAVMESGDARQTWRLRGRHFREWADRFTPQRKPLYALEQALHLFPRRVPAGTHFRARVELGRPHARLRDPLRRTGEARPRSRELLPPRLRAG